MINPENPYAPVDVGNPAGSRAVHSNSLMEIARRVFLDWEKLRLLYNMIVAIPTVVLMCVGGGVSAGLILVVLLGAGAANFLYMAGPLVESYVTWLGYRQSWPRYFLFWSGSLLSILLATYVVVMVVRGV